MSTKLPAVILADFTTSLATAVAVGATTATIQSNVDDDGVTLPDGLGYFTIDGSNSSKEHIQFVKTGANLASIQSVSRQGTLTSGFSKAHRLGATVTLTDFATIKYLNDLLKGSTNLDSSDPLEYDGTATISTANQLATKAYVDGVAIAGSADSSTTVKGIGKVSVAPVSATEPIFVGDNDTRLPTQGENDALVGTGTPSSTNPFVNVSTLTGTISAYTGSSAPTGWLLCDGSAVSRSTYANLFAITSTTFGSGDGSTTFNVPNLLSRSVVGAGSAGTKVATFASRSSNVITVTGISNASNNEFQTGQSITYNTSGSVITGLTNATVYYIIRISNTTFSLATTLANAIAGTVISLSSDGSGTQTFTQSLTARTLGSTGGEENHTLLQTQLPVSSAIIGAQDTYNSSSYNSTYAATNTGGSTAFNVLNPFLALTYIIKT